MASLFRHGSFVHCFLQCVVEVQESAGFHLIPSQQQLVSLISPAPPVLWLNVHTPVKTAAAWFACDWKGKPAVEERPFV